jgi:hypothetical protein
MKSLANGTRVQKIGETTSIGTIISMDEWLEGRSSEFDLSEKDKDFVKKSILDAGDLTIKLDKPNWNDIIYHWGERDGWRQIVKGQ